MCSLLSLSLESPPNPDNGLGKPHHYKKNYWRDYLGSQLIKTIKNNGPISRIIGIDVDTNLEVVSCFYGQEIGYYHESSYGVEVRGYEEIYIGGTWTDYFYNFDGLFVGKYQKVYKENDNADILWKVDVAPNDEGMLVYYSIREKENNDGTTTTKEREWLLYIEIEEI